MAKVLVIDDDRSLLRALRLGLQSEGHDVSVALSGESGLSQTAIVQPDVVVLDIGLPDIDVLEVCKRIREWSDVPIIILSATGAENRKIAALDGGANDYVTKPFSMAELEARIRVVVRNRSGDSEVDDGPLLEYGNLRLDLIHHEATLAGRHIALTGKEFDVLSFLARHTGRTCTHQMILGAVWGAGYGQEAQYVHAYVHRLRQKLGDENGQLIRSVPGVGYLLVHDEP
ncbi:MAG: response regulator transcription factor [Acidimicrobiaceae bacterium]|nr:response regulator transcription factor [Acidimicrobiaceae bacterium]